MIHLVTFATGQCVKGQKKMVDSAIKQGIHPDNIHTFGHDDVFNDPFVKENMHIFGERKGVGYWAWKPLLILKVHLNIMFGQRAIVLKLWVVLIRGSRRKTRLRPHGGFGKSQFSVSQF